MQVSRTQELKQLKAALRDAFPESVSQPRRVLKKIETGIEVVDRVLDGGLGLGTVSTWFGVLGSGLNSLLRMSVSHALNAKHRIAIVDGARTFHPGDWVGIGGSPSCWLVRPSGEEHLLWATEALTRSGAFSWVVVDVGSQGGATRRWQAHLKRAARKGGTALLVLATGGDVTIGTVAMKVTAQTFDFHSCRRTLKVALVRGGFPSSGEVVVDASPHVMPCRLPLDTGFPDRRARPKRIERSESSARYRGR